MMSDLPGFLDSVASSIIHSQWGMKWIVVVAIVLWLLSEAVNTILFRSQLARFGYRAPGFRLGAIPPRFKMIRTIGASWLIRRGHRCLILISLMILAVAALRAGLTGHSLEIARSGALVVVMALLSLLLGIWEGEQSRKFWDDVIANTKEEKMIATLKERRSKPIEDATRISIYYSVGVSIIGTMIWAYGDQVAACAVFPYFDIKDRSSVTCLAEPMFPNGPDRFGLQLKSLLPST